uniref:histidine kinase n=1 Tax=Candidatus Kentrum sp. LPFa TaxID=2126335 RepID=A0A450X3Y8_9GAMM|nr:MAG: Response regulator receiver domain-containing protein [Candidatus Kentron sp. LPFa]VFK23951.1 MAG: Response regulator receiver domain-containing protein [Candidatus Kentron sp. LPFa]
MNEIGSSDSFSSSNQQLGLVGQVLSARIKRVRLQSCELDLLDETGSVIAQGRLYQADSLAWEDRRLLAEIPKYRKDSILDKIFMRRLRYEDGGALWYVQERWGRHNPWDDLPLGQDDIITGTIARAISMKGGEHVGYLVQLEIDAPIQIVDAGIIGPDERVQPDIEVFLPERELPWDDGGLDAMPTNSNTKRMPLEIGDPIQALVREVRMPPMDPIVSVTRLIHRRDATANNTFKHRENLARWYFWRFLGKTKIEETLDAPKLTRDDMPYANRQLLLVDDDPRTLTAQAELLEFMGAKVHAVEVRPGDFTKAVDAVVVALGKEDFDLILVDNNLPGRDLGQALIGRIRARIGGEHSARFALITADGTRVPSDDTRAELRVKGAIGFVQRPLAHGALRKLLNGEEVWEDAKSHPKTKQSSSYLPVAKASPTLQDTLAFIAGQPGVAFALLVRAKRRIEAEDLITSGRAPFTWDEYPEVLRKTDLVLLIERKIEELKIVPQEGGNELLHAGRQIHSHWRILELGAARWIFGVGYESDKDIEGQLPLWRMALAAAMDAQGWREWARHVSSFVQLGMAHQGLSHEVIHLQGEFQNLLFILNRQIGKFEADAKLSEKNKEDLLKRVAALTRSNDDLLEFSQRQLRAQALRHRRVFLPEAVTTIRRIVDGECREAEVMLHVVEPLLLALPLSNAALILPVVNLLLNAIKHHYRQENRRVELLFDVEEIAKDKPMLIIDVRDNGPGLDQTALERLWQPGFSQASDPNKRHGIGLWLSRQLVEEAGGTLDLHENWRCIGASFRIRLPIHLG